VNHADFKIRACERSCSQFEFLEVGGGTLAIGSAKAAGKNACVHDSEWHSIFHRRWLLWRSLLHEIVAPVVAHKVWRLSLNIDYRCNRAEIDSLNSHPLHPGSSVTTSRMQPLSRAQPPGRAFSFDKGTRVRNHRSVTRVLGQRGHAYTIAFPRYTAFPTLFV
jgi:hypothetical protein